MGIQFTKERCARKSPVKEQQGFALFEGRAGRRQDALAGTTRLSKQQSPDKAGLC